LASRVIGAWIEQVAINNQLRIEKERVKVLQHFESIIIDRFKQGMGSLDELSAVKSQAAIALADLSRQQSSLQRSVRKIEVLLGRYPECKEYAIDSLVDIRMPLVEVPAKVLLNRPDIRAALARVRSSEYLASAAEKAILPEIRLSGQVFRDAARLDNLGGSGSSWSLLGGLFQPLFEGGRIIDVSRARKNESMAALEDLHSVVLSALKETEDALCQEHELAVQLKSIKTALLESEKNSNYFEERYRQGLDTIQSMLIAKEQEMQIRIRYKVLLAERMGNRVNLALVLGLGV